ncbi:MAG TPA: DUF2490 domain-containing protein [Bacteroidetes bacterium]|nr:DUF2490 domain-containing protein [Bacteroidota bacterium]
MIAFLRKRFCRMMREKSSENMKSIMYIAIGAFCFGMLTFSKLSAQRVEDQQWFSATISQDVRKFRWSLEQNVRMRYGFTITDNYFTAFGLRRKLNKRLVISANYRLGWKNPGINPAVYHRFNLDARLRKRWKKKDLELTWRPRIQVKFRPDKREVDRTWYIRNKLTLSRKLNKKMDLWGAAEIYTQLNEAYQGLNNDEWRAYLGLDIDVGKRKQLSLYYLYSKEFNQTAPFQTHVLGLNFAYRLKKMKKWKKSRKKKSKNIILD